MSKFLLQVAEDFEFDLIGIASHSKDYRLVWELNRELEIDLVKTNDYEIKRKGQIYSFAFYHFCNEENIIDFYLIANRSELGLLIPEEKKCDYFFLIKGNLSEKLKLSVLKKISQLKNVLTSFEVPVEDLKSKRNLIF